MSKRETSKGNAEELTLMVETRKNWQLISPTTTQAQNQGYELAQPSIHPICVLLVHMKGPVLQSQSCRISTTTGQNQDNQGESQ